MKSVTRHLAVCAAVARLVDKLLPPLENLSITTKRQFFFTRGATICNQLAGDEMALVELGVCAAGVMAAGTIIIFPTCNTSLDCFSGCVSEFWIPPLI